MFKKAQQIGHYEIHSQIGTGGMGEVYLALDSRLQRKVALKVLPENIAGDKDRLSRFEQEALAASALNHPNILTIFEFGNEGGLHFLATEYVEGVTLRQRISKKTLSLNEILEIAIQAASALSAAHKVGIIHRDIKPENVMIREDGYIKILDFGLAKPIVSFDHENEAESRKQIDTQAGVILGTAAYMSPEQATGKRVDARTDIFSLGVVLYEMFTGKQPFTGETINHTIIAVLEKKPVPVSYFVKDYPAEIERIIEKCLAKNAEDRYQTANDLLIELKELKEDLDFRSKRDATISFYRQTESETQILKAELTEETLSIPPNNLTTEFSPLIGRKSELEEIKKLLKQPEIRLLTITGVGGSGKTRIARTIAYESLLEFADGVYFISLSAIENPELVIPAIAQTFKIREESSVALTEVLRGYLRERNILIVLDSFEHITEAAPQIGELLSESLQLKILVTSSVRLQLRFEHEFTLQPLEIPFREDLNLEKLSEFPAIELFVQRARAVKPAFALSEDNAQAIAEICRSLDGLPLAIELAAVRIKMLAPRAILSRLSNSLKLLTGGARDLPARQQTMRAAIAWSYDLLEAEEKKLLNRLAIFSGGLTLDAAEAIAGENEDLTADLLDIMTSLVDKSLLTQREQTNGEPRFKMLKVVREFALEELNSSGEANEIRRRHSEFYARLAEIAEPELRAVNVAQWLEILELEHGNLRSAVEWSLENKPETALQIVGAIRSFWVRRGYLSEGSKWTKRAIDRNGGNADPKLLVKAYLGLATLNRFLGNLSEAGLYNEESLRFAREIGDKYWISVALGELGLVKFMQANMVSGRLLMEESLAIARELNDRRLISIRLTNLGEIAREQEDYEAAREFYEEALTIAKEQSSKYLISVYAFNLASAACLLEDYQTALSYARESLEVSEELGDKISIGDALNIFAALSFSKGNLKKAAHLWGAAQGIYDATGFKLEKVDREFNERYIKKARIAMTDEEFSQAFAKGRAMKLKNVIVLAGEDDQP